MTKIKPSFEKFIGKPEGQGFITYYEKQTDKLVVDFIITLSDCGEYLRIQGLKNGMEVHRNEYGLLRGIDELSRLCRQPDEVFRNHYGSPGEVGPIEVQDYCPLHKLVKPRTAMGCGDLVAWETGEAV